MKQLLAATFRVIPLLLLICALTTHAQSTQAQSTQEEINLGHAALPLYGPWKFQIGDSPINPATNQPRWAEPDFDDSNWESISLEPKTNQINPLIGTTGYIPGWGAQGHARTSGYGWYRIRIKVHAPPGEALALAGPNAFDDAYQVFQNGSLLGAFGGFNSKVPETYYAEPVVFPLTETHSANGSSSSQQDATQVIAFRFWVAPETFHSQDDAGGFHIAPLVGTADAVSAIHQLGWLVLIKQNVAWAFSGVMFTLLTVLAFALFLMNPADRAYLWMGLNFLAGALGDWETAFASWTQAVTVHSEIWICWILVIPVIRFTWVMLLRAWFRLERPLWLPWAAALLALVDAAGYAGGFGRLPFLPLAFAPACFVLTQLSSVAFLLLTCWLAFRGVRKFRTEGWLIVAPLVFSWMDLLASRLPFLHLSRSFSPFGILISPLQIEGVLAAIALCALLLRRWILSVRTQRQMALDVMQAQEVQQVILPKAKVEFPGLVVESEYRPAREVGGDFFQIIPHETDGTLLIVAGDVAGKGLQAGMLVALTVGAIRTEIAHTSDPMEMLTSLNLRLCGRGIATCLALRIEADGSATLANAGHMAPYLNSQPINMEGALPLGLFAGAEFSLMHFQLNENDRLTLMSDGIAEATDSKGNLFGFDRVQDLMRTAKTAADVANAAQSFGQEDDISVISIIRTRTAVEAPA